MKKFMLLLGVIALGLSKPLIAQPAVVVIPLGSDAQSLGNIITVAKSGGDFTDPVEANNSITNSSQLNPYLIVIAPGKYTLTESLDIKDGVSMVGSGINATILEGAIVGNFATTCALLGTAHYSTLSHLTVRNTGGDQCSIAIHNLFADPHIKHVNAIAQGATCFAYAIYNNESDPIMDKVYAQGKGPNSYGIYNASNGVATIRNSVMIGETIGLYIRTTGTRVTNSRISFGVGNNPAGLQCRDTYDVNLNDVNC